MAFFFSPSSSSLLLLLLLLPFFLVLLLSAEDPEASARGKHGRVLACVELRVAVCLVERDVEGPAVLCLPNGFVAVAGVRRRLPVKVLHRVVLLAHNPAGH